MLTYETARKNIKAHLTEEFVESMKFLFPLQRPIPGTALDAIMHDSGQQSIIEFLERQLEEASQTILE